MEADPEVKVPPSTVTVPFAVLPTRALVLDVHEFGSDGEILPVELIAANVDESRPTAHRADATRPKNKNHRIILPPL